MVKKERGGKNQSGGFISPFAGLARSLILPLAKRNSLPENVVLNRTYKQRAAQKKKEDVQEGVKGWVRRSKNSHRIQLQEK